MRGLKALRLMQGNKKTPNFVPDKDERALPLPRYHLASPAHRCPGALTTPAGTRLRHADWGFAVAGSPVPL